MKRFYCILLVLLLLLPLCAGAEGPGEEYISYQDFIARYAENLDLINESEGRHLISLIFSTGDTTGSTRKYSITGDTLSAELYTQKSEKRIVGMVLRLTAPAGVESSTGLARDFSTSGYQCYALLMAMANGKTAADRFSLIEELNNGLRDQEKYTTSVFPYTLCARREGSSIEFTFSGTYYTDQKTAQEEADAASAAMEAAIQAAMEAGEQAGEQAEKDLPDEDLPGEDFPETEEDTSLVG